GHLWPWSGYPSLPSYDLLRRTTLRLLCPMLPRSERELPAPKRGTNHPMWFGSRAPATAPDEVLSIDFRGDLPVRRALLAATPERLRRRITPKPKPPVDNVKRPEQVHTAVVLQTPCVRILREEIVEPLHVVPIGLCVASAREGDIRADVQQQEERAEHQ